MRKKLLALLMCATMVLGSSVVATAAPSNDDYKNAQKILTNSSKFIAEINSENATVKETVWLKSIQSNATFGFVDGTLQAVKLNDAGNALVYVGDAKDVTKYGTVKGTVTLETVVKNYLTASNLDATKKVTDLGLDKIIYKAEDALGFTHVIYAEASDVTKLAPIDANSVYTSVKELTSKKIGTIENGLYVEKDVYYTADGYSFVESGAELFAADTKSVKGAGIKCVKYGVIDKKNVIDNALLGNYTPTLAKALELGTITKDAVAVKLTAYSVVGDKDVYGSFKLQKVETPTSGYTVTSLSDLLSRTALTGSVNIFKLNEESPVTDYEMGAPIYPIGTVASNVSIADKSFTFDVAFTGDSDVIIFDQATAPADNAGQSDADATKPATDNSASPKTGDVAPIAALAVVMMGAFGAMVVASKKRA